MSELDSSQNDSSLQGKGQPLIDHLIELRTRLLHGILSVLIIFLPLFYVANDIYSYISEPLRQFLPEGATMIATDVASPFFNSV
jgi:sec-independent protein translocase protein TatC